jgi:CMP/dCMP kinase
MRTRRNGCAAGVRRCEPRESRSNQGQVAAQMKERDQRDSTRADAPLAQAPDALYLDSTAMGIEEVVDAILKIVRSRVTNGMEYR